MSKGFQQEKPSALGWFALGVGGWFPHMALTVLDGAARWKLTRNWARMNGRILKKKQEGKVQ